jgi:hypothetical protein
VNIKIAGALALVFYAIHAIVYYAFIARMPEGALWACHVGCAIVGVGCLMRKRVVVGVGALWLVYGTTVWLIDLASGSNLIPTSLCTHVGGVLVAAYAVRVLGWTRGASIVATIALFMLLGITRIATPPKSNINLVFSVPPGWEQRFPHYSTYFLFLFTTAFALFVALDAVLSRLFARTPDLVTASAQRSRRT